MENRFVEIRRELHRIPELGFKEFKTQKYLMDFIRGLPQAFLSVEVWETGIFVFVKGMKPSKTIGYRADMDGLPVFEQTEVDFSSEHNERMHACGHDIHMSIALGVLEDVVLNRVENNILFMFQPAEEGPGGAEKMIRNVFFKKYMPDRMAALHVSPSHKVGEVAIKSGVMFANTSEVHIEFVGKGGHAAFPHEANDAIVASSNFVVAVQSVVSRNVNPLDSVVVTFGEMNAGTANNVIAEKSRLVGTVRTLSENSMVMVKSRIKEIAHGVASSMGCDIHLEYKNDYVCVDNETSITSEFIRFLTEKSKCKFVPCETVMAGEDFGYILRVIPGFMFWLGVDAEYGLHHPKFNPNEEAIEVGIDCVSSYFRWLDSDKNS